MDRKSSDARGTGGAAWPNPGVTRPHWHAAHLCLACQHQAVCRVTHAIDSNLLVVISQCEGFTPAAAGRLE